MKLNEFHATIGKSDGDFPSCCSITYSVSAVDSQGAKVQRKQRSLVEKGMLGDPDQIPWLVAHTLQTMLEDLVRGGA